MKQALIEATFPELKGGFGHKSGRGRGGSAKVAISRAVGDLLKQVKGKRFSAVQARITIIEVTICELCAKERCECNENYVGHD